MVAHKHISGIITAVIAVAVILCFLAIGFADRLSDALGGTGVNMEYESKLFDTDQIISIDILMDEDEWNEMLENAMTEEYYVCDVVINGETIRDVAIRPKGNTSLSAIVSDPDSDRFSLKLEFDHFVEGQTCFGLDKLILNNNYADATNMKEAIIYDMYEYIGADASLYNYAQVSLNGEYRGVYLALEGVEKSFMLRNFGTQDGELYKPDSMEMGGGDKKTGSSGSGPSMPDMGDIKPGDMPDMGDFKPGDMPDMSDSASRRMQRPDMTETEGGDIEKTEGSEQDKRPDMGGFSPSQNGGPSMGGGGANLNYTDDDLDSYSTIWEGSITDTSKGDHRRVVTALKNISEGTDIEEYLDVDNVLKYMAVHTFAVNMDSLSGSMAHNYYLYEYDGQLSIFPWDYNLSFGGMSMGSNGDATEMVNDAIDTPFSGTEFFDALLENEEYRDRYHEYLRELCEEYVDGGRFDEVYTRIRSQIDELVETDPTAFYDGEEYSAAAETFYETVKLRAESILGQLNGTIPSTDEGQREDSSAFIDASHIDVKTMGQFNMGGVSDGDVGIKRGRSEREGQKPSSFEGTSAESPGQSGSNYTNILTYAICLTLMVCALIGVHIVRRKR